MPQALSRIGFPAPHPQVVPGMEGRAWCRCGKHSPLVESPGPQPLSFRESQFLLTPHCSPSPRAAPAVAETLTQEEVLVLVVVRHVLFLLFPEL